MQPVRNAISGGERISGGANRLQKLWQNASTFYAKNYSYILKTLETLGIVLGIVTVLLNYTKSFVKTFWLNLLI